MSKELLDEVANYLDEKLDRCARIAKREYKVWPSAYASGAAVKCRKGKIWKGVKEEIEEEIEIEENVGILTEIKLEQMGFPPEIIERIRAIAFPPVPKNHKDPKDEISELEKKLNPKQKELYLAWVGSVMKNLRTTISDAGNIRNKINSIIPASLINKLIQLGDQESVNNFDKINDSVREQVRGMLSNIGMMSLDNILSFSKQLKGFFTGYLPKNGVKVPQEFLDTIEPIEKNLIDSYFEEMKFMIFNYSNSIVLENPQVVQYFPPITKGYSLLHYVQELKNILINTENPKNIMNIEGIPKGYFWYDIGSSTCDIESGRMSHCGQDYKGTLYSLRSKSKEAIFSNSHITISYNDKEKTAYQIKGPGNSAPLPKYWSMIAAFFNHFGIKKSEEVGKGSKEDFGPLNDYLVKNTGVEIINPDIKEIEETKKRKYKPNFKREKEQGLHGWFARNKGKGWVNCRTGGPCGRKSADEGGKYPACRPTMAQCKSAGKGPLRKKKSSKNISWVKEGVQHPAETPYYLASKTAYQDDEGRVFVILQMPSGKKRIFYNSTGTGTPGLDTKSLWIPMNGIALLPRNLEIYYVKDDGKVPSPDSEEGKVREYLKTYGFREAPEEHKKVYLSFKLNPTTKQDLQVNAKVFNDIFLFNKWAKDQGAVMNTGRFSLPGINLDFSQIRKVYPNLFPQEQSLGEVKMKKEDLLKIIKEEISNTIISEGLKYHIETKTSLFNPIYRPGSQKFNELMLEAKQRLNKGHNFTEAEADWLSTDVGLTGIYEGKVVPLDLPLIEEELNEAEYKGKQVQLGKPQRGGSKKFYVYVKDGDRVKKISFGDPNLSVKVGDAKRRASFVARHRCKEKNDRLTAGYWSCRIGRYPHLTGAKQRYTWW